MTIHGGQDPPDRRSEKENPDAQEPRSSSSDGDVLPLRDQPKTSWWEETLRHLGDDILDDPVPERLRSILSTETEPS